MKKARVLFIFFSILVTQLVYSQNGKVLKRFAIENPTAFERSFETISLSRKQLGLSQKAQLANLSIRVMRSAALLPTQSVDENADGIDDVLLFQPVLKPKETLTIEILDQKNPAASPELCYSKFVPERIDDYAWENDKVAFRTYGPTAQRLVEENQKGGTLSSGIDAWMKRVDYPVLDKWYEKYIKKTGTYHEDTGEGLDNFHVGDSRGIGGIAVKKDTVFYTSKNFISWKKITTGPIRTSFVLTYANWDAAGKKITETKKISLDYGSFLYKNELTITGTHTVAIGLTLHKNTGTTNFNSKQGWMAYWETADDSEIGSGVVAENPVLHYDKIEKSRNPDLKNSYLTVKVKNNTVTYYAGFGWKKQGTFTNKEQWLTYLKLFSEKLKNPLKIKSL